MSGDSDIAEDKGDASGKITLSGILVRGEIFFRAGLGGIWLKDIVGAFEPETDA